MRPSRRTARTVVLRICAFFPLSDLSSNINGDCNGYTMNRTIASARESCQETRPRALFKAKWRAGERGSGRAGERETRKDIFLSLPPSPPRSPALPMNVMHHWHSAYSLSLRGPEVDSQNRLRYFARL